MSTLDYYNRNARAFVEGSVNADMKEHYERFLIHVPEVGKILDLGCGSGRDTAYFRSLGYEVTPVDGSIEVCKLAEEKLRTPVRCLLFEDLDYQEEFDAVWACASLLHVDRQHMPEVMKRVENALREGGVLYASFKYGDEEVERNGRSFNNYNEESVKGLFDDSWALLDLWISTDVRPGRGEEMWVNVISRKLNS